MTFISPIFFVLFFGIFHILGGLAVGKAMREKVSGRATGTRLLVWGMLMGATPILFSWFFLINTGETLAGAIGPALFLIAVIVGGIFFHNELSRKNEQSIAAVLMGGTALMLGILLIPYLLEQAQTRDNLGLADYLCGGFIPIIFILVGASFTWTGLSAISKKRTFDEHITERESELEERSSRQRRK